MQTLRMDSALRPIINAVNTNVVIKNARMVAIFIPDKNKYTNSPHHAHTSAGFRAGMRRVMYGINLKMEKNIANSHPPTSVI